MKVITAPEIYAKQPGDVFVFLAGGITKCPDWQSDAIKNLGNSFTSRFDQNDHLIIFNPRRKDFDITDPDASIKQIEWEFNALENCDIFSMFFCASESVQPICMYELGRNITRMQMRFPKNWDDRLIITSEKDYSRCKDVEIQSRLATDYYLVGTYDDYDNAIVNHAKEIADAYRKRRYLDIFSDFNEK